LLLLQSKLLSITRITAGLSDHLTWVRIKVGRKKKESTKMRRIIFSVVGILVTSCLNITAAHAGVQDDVDQAVTIVERFQAIPERAIPDWVLRNARGLAILTVTKAGFIGSARGGSGIVVARTGKGWSAPSAIGTGGLGVGFQAGVEITEFVIVLNTQEAVDAFSKQGNVTLGANLSAAAGPVGRTAEANVALQTATYTYSISQGLFAGVSLEGTVIATRDDANAEYYGKPVTAKDILAGKVKSPAGERKLLKVLSKYPA
jgi:SH3 domain-containing YSC84-like protein 1